jgi:hypothetical protein
LKVLTIVSYSDTTNYFEFWGPLAGAYQLEPVAVAARQSNKGTVFKGGEIYPRGHELCNDPSAGSPTERFVKEARRPH